MRWIEGFFGHWKSYQVTSNESRLGHQGERGGITQCNPHQDDVGQFPGGGFDHGGVIVQDEDGGGECGGQKAEAGEGDAHDGLRRVPADVLQGDW